MDDDPEADRTLSTTNAGPEHGSDVRRISSGWTAPIWGPAGKSLRPSNRCGVRARSGKLLPFNLDGESKAQNCA